MPVLPGHQAYSGTNLVNNTLIETIIDKLMENMDILDNTSMRLIIDHSCLI